MYDKCYFCLDQLPKLKKESTASFFVNFGGAGVQKSGPTLLYLSKWFVYIQGFMDYLSQWPLDSLVTSAHHQVRAMK